MEENKKCVDGICEKCSGGGCCSHKCCGHHKCGGIFKILIPIILIALAFYLGAMTGRGDDFRGRMGGQRFIDKVDEVRGNLNSDSATGSATVNVLPEEKTTDTTTPVLQ